MYFMQNKLFNLHNLHKIAHARVRTINNKIGDC